MVKLEALRSLMFGTEVVVVDPEAEYKPYLKPLEENILPLASGAKLKLILLTYRQFMKKEKMN